MWVKFAGRHGGPADDAGGASRASLRLFSAGVGELLTSTEYKLQQNTLKNSSSNSLSHTHTLWRRKSRRPRRKDHPSPWRRGQWASLKISAETRGTVVDDTWTLAGCLGIRGFSRSQSRTLSIHHEWREKMRIWNQEVKMSCVHRFSRFILGDIWKELRTDLLQSWGGSGKRSAASWMPSCVGMVEHVQSEESRGRLGAHWGDYISCLALEPLGIPKEELEDVENDFRGSLTKPAATGT